MTDLLARLEVAEAGSRELDAAMAVVADKAERVIGHWRYNAEGRAREVEPVTTSLDAALALAERVLPGWGWMVRHYAAGQGGPGWCAYVCEPDADLVESGPVNSAPALALCIAILKATAAARQQSPEKEPGQ
jgi:hypothetical protein